MKSKLNLLLTGLILYAILIPAFSIIVAFLYVIKSIRRLNSAKSARNKILVLAAFFEGNAGYQWRVQKWTEILESNNYSIRIIILWDENKFNNYLRNYSDLLQLYYISKRAFQLFRYSLEFDRIIVRRESVLYADLGWHIIERIQAVLFKERILDVDDDLAAAKSQPIKLTLPGRFLGMHSKPYTTSKRFYNRFIAGNKALKSAISEIRPDIEEKDIIILPTCYEVIPGLKKEYSRLKNELVLGWIGTNGNQYVLDSIIDELNKLWLVFKFEFRIISGKTYSNTRAQFPIINRKWNLEIERDELLSFDIGLMPLTGKSHESGKSGFKLIQYMSLGLVSVASAIGINNELIKDGENGWLVNPNLNNWSEVIIGAINQNSNWKSIGINARSAISKEYSFKSNQDKLLRFLSD